jgi:hypothetical protein
MKKLPDHLRLQEESPVLRVTCEMIDGKTRKEKFVTTDLKLLDEVMKKLISFELRAVTRKKLIDLLKSRTGRYGHVRINDDQTNAYVGISVTPDPVIRVRLSAGASKADDIILLTELSLKIDELFEDARLPENVRENVRGQLKGKESFEQHIFLEQGGERDHVNVRIGYVNSNGFNDEPSSDKKKKWRGPGA